MLGKGKFCGGGKIGGKKKEKKGGGGVCGIWSGAKTGSVLKFKKSVANGGGRGGGCTHKRARVGAD